MDALELSVIDSKKGSEVSGIDSPAFHHHANISRFRQSNKLGLKLTTNESEEDSVLDK